MPSGNFIRFLLNNPGKVFLLPVIVKIRPYTMLPIAALCQAYDLVCEIDRKKIEGAIVEMGCWKGGAGAYMAYADEYCGAERTVWLFDSFEGLPEPTIEDKEKAQKKGWKIRDKADTEMRPLGLMKARVTDVETIARTIGLKKMPKTVRGWFQKTVPGNKDRIGRIALLRIDADLYESTKYCLDSLYDSVSEGGIIIFDDYDSFEGSRKALYEFFHERNISPELCSTPFGGRMYLRKRTH